MWVVESEVVEEMWDVREEGGGGESARGIAGLRREGWVRFYCW